MKLLEACLRQDEGEVLKVYLDSKGLPTCGVGHHLYVGSPVPKEASEAFLRQDIDAAFVEYVKIPRVWRSRLNKARARVIMCMVFNMGLASVLKFKDMWAAIEREDWPAAKAEMLDSDWAKKDVGDGPGGRYDRAERLAEIMLTGVWPGEDSWCEGKT